MPSISGVTITWQPRRDLEREAEEKTPCRLNGSEMDKIREIRDYKRGQTTEQNNRAWKKTYSRKATNKKNILYISSLDAH